MPASKSSWPRCRRSHWSSSTRTATEARRRAAAVRARAARRQPRACPARPPQQWPAGGSGTRGRGWDCTGQRQHQHQVHQRPLQTPNVPRKGFLKNATHVQSSRPVAWCGSRCRAGLGPAGPAAARTINATDVQPDRQHGARTPEPMDHTCAARIGTRGAGGRTTVTAWHCTARCALITCLGICSLASPTREHVRHAHASHSHASSWSLALWRVRAAADLCGSWGAFGVVCLYLLRTNQGTEPVTRAHAV